MNQDERIKYLEESIDSFLVFRKEYSDGGVADFLIGNAIGFLNSLRLIEQGGSPGLSEESYARQGMALFNLEDKRKTVNDKED